MGDLRTHVKGNLFLYFDLYYLNGRPIGHPYEAEFSYFGAIFVEPVHQRTFTVDNQRQNALVNGLRDWVRHEKHYVICWRPIKENNVLDSHLRPISSLYLWHRLLSICHFSTQSSLPLTSMHTSSTDYPIDLYQEPPYSTSMSSLPQVKFPPFHLAASQRMR